MAIKQKGRGRGLVLAGDVGGTNVRLAVVELDGRHASIVARWQGRSKSLISLEAAVESFLRDAAVTVTAAGFGVAGPVEANESVGTNIPLRFSSRELAGAVSLQSALVINDFQALGAGLQYASASHLATVQAGDCDPRGTIALIGAGTGLGEAFLTWNGTGYGVNASEGGHVTFAPRDELEWGFREYLSSRYGHVSCERVLSGQGLVALYKYLIDTNLAHPGERVAVEMDATDPAAVITRHANDGSDPGCIKAVQLFASMYGAQAGNLALTTLAKGGLYIGGGIAPRITQYLTDGAFIRAMSAKGRLGATIENIPVHIVMSDDVALFGAAIAAVKAAMVAT